MLKIMSLKYNKVPLLLNGMMVQPSANGFSAPEMW